MLFLKETFYRGEKEKCIDSMYQSGAQLYTFLWLLNLKMFYVCVGIILLKIMFNFQVGDTLQGSKFK